MSCGVVGTQLTGTRVPYSAYVDSEDRGFVRRQKITTSNGDITHYAASYLFTKNVTPSVAQVYSVQLVLTA